MFVTREIEVGEEIIEVDFFSTKTEVANDSCGWQDVSGFQVYDDQPDYIDVLGFDYMEGCFGSKEREAIDAYMNKHKYDICKELSKVETEVYREWGIYDLGGDDKQRY